MPQFKTRVYDDGSLTNVKERFTGDNEKHLGIDLAILKSISPGYIRRLQILRVLCLPPVSSSTPPNIIIWWQMFLITHPQRSRLPFPYYDPRPAYEKMTTTLSALILVLIHRKWSNVLLNWRYPEITAPGDKPKYEIVYRNDNRYVVFTAAGVKASSSPGGNMGFFNLRFDKAPDEYNIAPGQHLCRTGNKTGRPWAVLYWPE